MSDAPRKGVFTLTLPRDITERLRTESLSRKIPVTEIIVEAVSARYHSQQSDAIRRVVLDVLEELGLHKQMPSKDKRKPSKAFIPITDPGLALSEPGIMFTDNEDGTVTDSRTGLVWLKDAHCLGRSDWESAVTQVQKLGTGVGDLQDGSVAGDWRLPSREELLQLVDRQQQDPSLPVGHPFLHVQHSSYWTASSRDSDNDCVWIIHLSRGRLNYSGKSGNYGIWPVREGAK